jgi:rubrerythrin
MCVFHNNKRFKARRLNDGTFSLDLSKKGIYNISDIQGLIGMQNLTVLKLDNNHIREIIDLETLQDLRILSLASNEIKEIERLDSLYNLEKLDLSFNQIHEIRGLDSLKNLRELNLWNNHITKIKGLANLDNLRTITLSGNPVYNWVRRTLGSYRHLARDLVIYCKKMEGKIVFDKEDFNRFLERQRGDIEESIRKHNYDEVMSAIAEVFYTARTEDRTLFYDFVGKFLMEYPELQKNSRFKDAYNFRLNVLLSKDQRYEMDNYLLQNFFSVKPTVASLGTHFCPNCGTKVEPNWKNCPHCGNKLEREISDVSAEGYLKAPVAAPPEIFRTHHPETSKSNGFGIVSIIIGLIGCCCFWCAGILAIILAMIGLAEDDEKALATIGLIIGICGVCGGVFQLFLVFGFLIN